LVRSGVPQSWSWVKKFTYHLGLVLTTVSLLMLLPALFGIIVGVTEDPRELTLGVDLLLISVSLGIFGLSLSLFKPEEPLSLRDGLIVVVLAWLTVPLAFSIPYTVALRIPFLDSAFEGVSGFTTTGLTMFKDVESLPRCILLWRSLTQWIGGLGLVVVMITIFARPGALTSVLYTAEGREMRIEPTVRRTLKQVFKTYVTLTMILAAIFFAAGMPLFDSFNHAMTAIATGGFSVKNESIGGYGSSVIELACILGMFLGAQSFLDHFHLLRGRIREGVSVEMKTFVATATIALIVVVALLYAFGIPDLERGPFQAVSALSTTGFHTVSVKEWERTPKLFLSLLMLLGGSIFSTAGGIKVIRLILFLKVLSWKLKSFVYPPTYVTIVKIGREEVGEDVIVRTLLVIALFGILTSVSTFLIAPFAPDGYMLEDVAFEVSSAIGTVGLSTGLTSPELHPFAKLVFMATMLLGRLEILTVFAAIYSIFRRKV